MGLAACATPGDRPPPTATDSVSGQAAGAPVRSSAEDTTLPARPSKLHVNRTETFYDVTGRDPRALLLDLQRRGPRIGKRRHFGRTRWTARWEIEYARPVRSDGTEAPGRACHMRRADVHLDVEVTLPRWNAPPAAPAALQHSWSSFIDALAFHEREHQESIVSAGRRATRALERMQAPTCAALKEKANARARQIIEESRAYNRHYDERTGHGRTQGARWPR